MADGIDRLQTSESLRLDLRLIGIWRGRGHDNLLWQVWWLHHHAPLRGTPRLYQKCPRGIAVYLKFGVKWFEIVLIAFSEVKGCRLVKFSSSSLTILPVDNGYVRACFNNSSFQPNQTDEIGHVKYGLDWFMGKISFQERANDKGTCSEQDPAQRTRKCLSFLQEANRVN